ncbi:hypothetical protein OROMI_008577 [Orobanche minor]
MGSKFSDVAWSLEMTTNDAPALHEDIYQVAVLLVLNFAAAGILNLDTNQRGQRQHSVCLRDVNYEQCVRTFWREDLYKLLDIVGETIRENIRERNFKILNHSVYSGNQASTSSDIFRKIQRPDRTADLQSIWYVDEFETRLLREIYLYICDLVRVQHPLYYYCFQVMNRSHQYMSNLAKHLRTYILGLIQEALNKLVKVEEKPVNWKIEKL